ncbi:MAG: TrpR-like protein, YerC/YecD [Clostridia bacterium]|nr:TrpR-like protein, YerC/YecD [Clostridia bacterium]
MNTKLDEDNLKYLFEVITVLETPDECRRFFEDLCTVPELNAMSRRLMVAKLLSENTVYSEIVAKTSASTATISRVNRSLNYTSCDGYSLVFERMKQKEDNA